MKTSKTSIFILAIVIIAAAIFLVLDRVHVLTNPSPTFSSTLSTSSASITLQPSYPPIQTSSWKIFSSPRPPFSIKYPDDLVFSTSTIPTIDEPYLLALQFPKDIYFSTVLKDEAYIIVTASSTCPAIEPGGLVGDAVPMQISTYKGISFTRNEVNDVAAGNRYLTVTYDTMTNGLCYRITFFDHGANGAGLYLSDPVAIQKADATHLAELTKIEAIVYAIVGTFNQGATSVPVAR